MQNTDPFGAGPYTRLQLLLRLGIAGDSWGWRRGALLAAIAWLPLALLSIAEGTAFRGSVGEPLLLDIGAHVRYLVALPLFVLAEAHYLPRLAFIARHFVDGGFIDPDDRGRYDALIKSIHRILASPLSDVAIVAFAVTVTMLFSPDLRTRPYSTWLQIPSSSGSGVTLAGRWAFLVSQPIFVSLSVAWLWRVLLWAWFLLRVSRLRLRLIAAHPDQSGGLNFVTTSVLGFVPLGLAIGAQVAAAMAELIVFGGRSAVDFRYLPLATAIGVVVIFAGPPLVFGGALTALRNEGTFQYGQLSRALGEAFETKWIKSGRAVDASALEAPDFSATVDLYQVVANVRSTNLVLVDIKCLAPLVLMTLVPFVPVVFLALPVEQIAGILMNLFL